MIAPSPRQRNITTVTRDLESKKSMGKRTKGEAKKSQSYFCMNLTDKVQCFEKETHYDCWHYYPVYDYRKEEQVNRREKVSAVPNVYALRLSTRADAKNKTFTITPHVSNTRCYVDDKEMECFVPGNDPHDISKFPCV